MNVTRAAGESDYKPRVTSIEAGRLLTGTSIEIIREANGRGGYSHALFDFDGTLSLLREGWPDVMAPILTDELVKLPGSESEDECQAYVRDLISRTTGKQTIYQMIEFCAEIRRRGGEPLAPEIYKSRYLDQLMERIRDRLEGLRCGRIDPKRYAGRGFV